MTIRVFNPESEWNDVTHASSRKDVVIATVQSIVLDRYPYAVAVAKGVSGTITFSLGRARGVWQENARLEPGMQVVLGDLRKKKVKDPSKKSGWRAFKARFLRPGDEESKQLKF